MLVLLLRKFPTWKVEIEYKNAHQATVQVTDQK